MGEHQCTECGHITTGFEQQRFDADAALVSDLKARLGECVALMQSDITEGKTTPTETRLTLMGQCLDIINGK